MGLYQHSMITKCYVVMLKTDTIHIAVIFIKFVAVHGNIWAGEGGLLWFWKSEKFWLAVGTTIGHQEQPPWNL